MNIYMVQNSDTGEWWGQWGWQEKHHKGSIWKSRKGPGGIKGRYKFDKPLMDIVTFELKEIKRD